jgi:hypothetical protein
MNLCNLAAGNSGKHPSGVLLFLTFISFIAGFFVSFYVPVSPPIHQLIYPSMHPSVHLLTHPFMQQPIHLLTHPSTHPSINQSFHPSINQSIQLSTHHLSTLPPVSCWLLAWPILRSWRWGRYVPGKRRSAVTGPHGVTSQCDDLRCITVILYVEPIRPSSCFLLLGYFLSISSTFKVETVRSSKISVNVYQTTRRHIPEDSTLHAHRCENLRSNMLLYQLSSSRLLRPLASLFYPPGAFRVISFWQLKCRFMDH